MASVEELRQRPQARIAWLLLIEGVPWGFTDERELTLSWWSEDDRVILPGLKMPQELRIGQDIKSGQFENQSATFELTDFDGEVIPGFFGNLNKAENSKNLGQRILPTDDPAPHFAVDTDQGAVDLWGSYIGTEAIGPEGERNYYSATPWAGTMPGQDHPAYEEPYATVTSNAVGPFLVEGRRIAVYRVFHDPDGSGVWKTEETPFWWGKLRAAGDVRENNIWSIECDGPESWLEKPLNSRTATQWWPISADLALNEGEDAIGLQFTKAAYDAAFILYHGIDDTTYTVNSSDVVGSIATAVAGVAAMAGVNGLFTDDGGGGAGIVSFAANAVVIGMSNNPGNAGRMFLNLHHRVWQLIGYDPIADYANLEGERPYFFGEAPVGSGYYMGLFSSTPAGFDPMVPSGDLDWTGKNVPRIYTPTYTGTVSVLSEAAGQVVHLEVGDVVYVEGQTIRPRTTSFINGSLTTAARWWAFKGMIQLEGQEEPEETVQIARCSWYEDFSGSIALSGVSNFKGLVIDEWLDPRLYHCNFKPLPTNVGWASRDESDVDGAQITAAPLAVFGVWTRSSDSAHETLLRTLLSTGSAVWDPTGTDAKDADGDLPATAAAYLTEGVNAIGGNFPVGDYEIADLGLAIPISMIDTSSFPAAASDLPGGGAGPLSQGKVAVVGAIQSQELLAQIMESRGWAWSLIRGQYGIYSPHVSSEIAFDEEEDFEITESDLAGVAGDPSSVLPTVGLRPVFPYERLNVQYAADPLEGFTGGQEEYAYKARDVGARARSGKVEKSIAASDLLATQWWVGDTFTKISGSQSWTLEIRELWEKLIPGWLARPHRLIQGLKILPHKAQDLGVGSIIRLTNPWPPNTTGTYGLTNVTGRVVSIAHNTLSGVATIDVLAEATAPNALRWAPIVRVIDDAEDPSDRYDPGTKTLYLQDFGVDVATVLPAFVKPADLDAPEDNCQVVFLGFDDDSWTELGTAYVASVDTAAKSMTFVNAPSLSTDKFPSRRRIVVVLLREPEVAWPDLRYPHHTPLGGADGQKKLPKI